MIDSSDSSEDELVIRQPRRFRLRTMYNHLQESYEYNERFRLDLDTFAYVLQKIEPVLEHPTKRNNAVTPHQQLQIALHWLGSGAQYHCIGDMHGVSKATVCRVIKNVVNAVNTHILSEHVRRPDDVATVVHQFSQLAGMPRICGAVDGTLIKMDAPAEFEPIYVDRHGNHSINVMLVCGADLKFYYAYANWPGSTSDARVLRNSGLFHRMEEGWRPFPGTVLLGDSIYPLKPWLIPPVIRNEENVAERRFLRAHKKTRRVIECAIGILKEKFPCLNYLRLEPEYVCKVVLCCVALCNLTKTENFVINVENDGDEQQNNGAVSGEEEEVGYNEDVIQDNEMNNHLHGRDVLNYFYQDFAQQ